MTTLFNSPGAPSLLANVVAIWAMVWLVNLPAQRLGLSFGDATDRISFAPDGGVIASVWIVLFAAMACARWLLATSGANGAYAVSWFVVAFAVWCALYIYYTVGLAKLTGLPAEWLSLGATLLTIAFAATLTYVGWSKTPLAGALTGAVTLWTLYAGAITVALVRTSAA